MSEFQEKSNFWAYHGLTRDRLMPDPQEVQKYVGKCPADTWRKWALPKLTDVKTVKTNVSVSS